MPSASSDAIEVIDLIYDDEDLPSSEIGTNGEFFVPSTPLMNTATDEAFEVADVQLVTKFNNEISQDALLH